MRTSNLFTWVWFTFMPKWVVLRKDVFSFRENKDSNVKFTSFVNLYKLKFYFSLPPRVFKFFFFFWVDCLWFRYLSYWFWLRLNDEEKWKELHNRRHLQPYLEMKQRMSFFGIGFFWIVCTSWNFRYNRFG